MHITFAALQELEFMCCTLNSAAFNLLACTFEVEILFACKDQILLPAWLPFLHCFPFKHCFRSAVIVNEARVRSPKLLCKTCMLMFTHAPALLKMCHWNAKLDVTSLKCQTCFHCLRSFVSPFNFAWEWVPTVHCSLRLFCFSYY